MIEPGNPVKDIEIKSDSDILQIFDELSKSGGFESTNLSMGLEILTSMISDKKCLKFVSFVGAIVSTGLRGIIKDMLKNKWFDVAITTCGALDHDIARHYSNYKEGSFTMDDNELANQNIHRLGNVLVPMESYGPLIEEKMQKFLEEEYKSGVKEMSTADITRMIGKHLGEDSFLHWAYKNNIPVVVPGIMDGAVGSQIWLFSQKHSDFKLNLVADADLLSGLIFKAEKSGSLMLGGGISKHHTLWWNQYREGLDYALYITTAQEFDGSLSGALVREAISWGKVTQKAMQSTLHAEVTTILPFLYAALLAKLK
ncbi:deoxyhypusine synthase [Nitrosopumilus sp. b1]|uniref:deoxyhypusine synthase n=1 Tax=Nitrosopumilus sp. b1 TaxID=2109907 RepID=UPI000E2CA94D|nr:deoxyhypusine synthase [Nitrosopumilus sp. b1]RDJ31350.1 MAG: deoxyhypusine synthase [Thermoproteota archaeon]KAF6242487.1 deoxyhypusine synthase [Nitrosopumilus sp. b1]RDJ33875.1 MAG: deoxyhypusine synthase [Thermoproteota archaeon]RDJ37014.1 MAG: deoxyhypusine synthase [Thermoproteota archaeon]RDJ37451.1 MAG: deoxyhypusine synthase [Thermoproteota archaeon]